MSASKVYDSLIIGGGPGGLSVALGLGRQNRSCLVISHKHFRNDGIEASHAVLGHDHVHPQTILSRARDQIARYQNTSYALAEIISAQKVALPQWRGHEGFKIESREGETWYGKTLALATGVRDLFPSLEGYRENWPRNIYQCLFCDGWERRRSEKAVLCYPELKMQDVKMASMALGQDTTKNENGTAKVTILANGPYKSDKVDPALVKQLKAVMARGVKLDQRKVIRLEDTTKENEGLYVHLRDHETGEMEKVFFAFLVHKPNTQLNARNLIEQLGLEITPGMFGDIIETKPMMPATNVPGVYIAGDAGNVLTHVTTALSTGIGAAGGIVHYLNEKDDEDALESIGQGGIPDNRKQIDGTGCSTDT
ncbi:hypothetical protein LTS08_007838 [Lithohypha guttulata]|nr:hypothetical protein LTS08_007838 [Lithohypha guttulata]